jgi:predicted flap endonuclease-1-like 5' DNA nuclease
MKQHMPIKGDERVPSIGLGSKYAQQLGLEGIEEYNVLASADEDQVTKAEACVEENGDKKTGGKKKKKKNKKKH